MGKYTVALDCMGGDNAPIEPVKGAVMALKSDPDLNLILTGPEDEIRRIFNEKGGGENADRVTFQNTTEVIETAEMPTKAIMKKKDSSLVVAMNLVKHDSADAFVSAGSTGAVLVGGQTIIGRIPGVKRAPLAPLIPTEKGVSLLIDCGANMDSKPINLLQFARMGSIYMNKIMKIDNPKVAIVNVGAEEEKGNMLVKETFPQLKALPGINFIGSIEARDITAGYADVIVCDAFVGNVILKMYEGVGITFFHLIKKAYLKNLKTKLGAALTISSLKEELKKFDPSKYGGAPMLGLKKLVVKTHGSSKAQEFSTSILQCKEFKEQKISETVAEMI